LDYTPHRIAQSLASGKTYEIILATHSELVHPYINELVEQMHLVLGRHGYHLALELLHHFPDEASVYRTFVAGRCDGVIGLGLVPSSRAALLEKQAAGLPVVAIDAANDPAFDSVCYDLVEAVRLAVAHLLQQGHRRVALVYDTEPGISRSLRLRGYQTALREAGVPFEEALLFPWPVNDDPRALWRRVAAVAARPTAAVVYNDELAVGLEHAVRLAGLRVPADLALVAQSNTRVLRLAEVPMSAVDLNNHGIATAVVERMLEKIGNPPAHRKHILVQPSLIVRESSVKT
jgi:LacI family transcriptional regulator